MVREARQGIRVGLGHPPIARATTYRGYELSGLDVQAPVLVRHLNAALCTSTVAFQQRALVGLAALLQLGEAVDVGLLLLVELHHRHLAPQPLGG